MANVLAQCAADIGITVLPRATITTALTTQTPAPTIETSNSHPAYDPCPPNLPGDALSCSDLSAAQRPLRVQPIGVDPYRLDRGRGAGVAPASHPLPKWATRPPAPARQTCGRSHQGKVFAMNSVSMRRRSQFSS